MSVVTNTIKFFDDRLSPAHITWRGETPHAKVYDDSYYQDDGAAESRHVYIDGNDLRDRFANTQDSFCIAETGFGVGLNFALTYDLWRRQAPANARLHYVSVEKHPVSAAVIRQALTHLQVPLDIVDAIVADWPSPSLTWHIIELPNNVQLTLIFDDVAALSEFRGTVDAWYLDGFAPSNNPAMWQQSVFDTMRRTATVGTTAASFSVARQVRDGVESAGFTVYKRQGFGRKRHCLSATTITSPSLSSPIRGQWFPQSAAIVGSGIMGCAVARALADRGIRVQIFERSDSVAAGTSGNPGALIAPPTQSEPNPHAIWSLQAYTYALSKATQLGFVSTQGWLSGAGEDAVDRSKFAKAVAWMFGLSIKECANSYPWTYGVAVPMAYGSIAKACHQLIDHSHISVSTNSDITLAEYEAKTIGHQSFDVLVDCTGIGLNNNHNLRQIRGQIDQFRCTPAVLSGPIYTAPTASAQSVWTGATFDEQLLSAQTTSADTALNWRKLQPWLAIETRDSQISEDSWAGIRHTSRDHMPIIGAYQPLQRDMRLNRQQFREQLWSASQRQTHYVAVATGTRGMGNGMLGAQIIASLILGDPMPIPAEALRAVLAGR